MKQTQKIYKAYTSYGRHPLTDTEVLVRISQNRKKWQGKPVCKLYERVKIDKGRHYMRTQLVKTLMDSGKSYQEACKIAEDI
jgi:hypothetical protein